MTMIFTVVKRRALPEIVEIIKRNAPTAFYSVEDVRQVSQGSPYPMRQRDIRLLESVGKED